MKILTKTLTLRMSSKSYDTLRKQAIILNQHPTAIARRAIERFLDEASKAK